MHVVEAMYDLPYEHIHFAIPFNNIFLKELDSDNLFQRPHCLEFSATWPL